jgi:hypothetical protein
MMTIVRQSLNRVIAIANAWTSERRFLGWAVSHCHFFPTLHIDASASLFKFFINTSPLEDSSAEHRASKPAYKDYPITTAHSTPASPHHQLPCAAAYQHPTPAIPSAMCVVTAQRTRVHAPALASGVAKYHPPPLLALRAVATFTSSRLSLRRCPSNARER